MDNILITHDEIVSYDNYGWPLYQLRVISLLRTMGISDDIINLIPEDILTSTITTLEDEKQSPDGELHGMGYGVNIRQARVNEGRIVNCAIDKDKNTVYLWRIPNVRVVDSRKAPKEDEHD